MADEEFPMTVHYVTYLRELRIPFDGAPNPVSTLALAEIESLRLGPGDVVQLLQGSFWPPVAAVDETTLTVTPSPVTLRGVRGAPEAPICIRGSGGATRIVGSNAATPVYPRLPTAQHFAFFRLIDCAWMEISDMTVESCWPCFVYLENCENIAVRGVEARDGVYLVFARGHSTRRILVEKCRIRQDPTGTMWPHLDWTALHHGDYAFFNGGLFGAEDIVGEVVIRHNVVEDAFNAIRIVGADGRSGYDVEIHENIFRRIRDNAVEPETFAENWLIHDNLIDDAHAWFSFDGVRGGWRHVLGNRGTFRSQPGQSHLGNRGGRVLKFDADAVAGDPQKPSVVAHNSWNTRSFVAKESKVRGLRHQANLVVFCQTCLRDDDVCPERATMTSGFGDLPSWPADVLFDWDQTTFSFGIGVEMPPPNQKNGMERSKVCFHAPGADDFRPVGDVLATPALTFKAAADWPSSEDWRDARKAPRSGLFGGADERFEAPPFHSSPQASGPARISRVRRVSPDRIEIWLAAPPISTAIDARVWVGGTYWSPLATTIRGRLLDISAAGGVDLRNARIQLRVDRETPALTGWACPDVAIEVAARAASSDES